MSAKSFGPTKHDCLLAAILLSWTLAKHEVSSCDLPRKALDFIVDHILDTD